jgi:hypothetical protein
MAVTVVAIVSGTMTVTFVAIVVGDNMVVTM